MNPALAVAAGGVLSFVLIAPASVALVGLGTQSVGKGCGVAGATDGSPEVQSVPVNADSGPGPGGISAEDWAKVQTYANAKQIDPLVLVSIGMHETDWGRLGDGRLGNVLGVGSYDAGSTYKYAGIDGQLAEGTRLLASWDVHTIDDLAAGKAADWATDPNWESAVLQWYGRLSAGLPAYQAPPLQNAAQCDTTAAGGASSQQPTFGLALPLPRELLSVELLSRPHHDHPALDIGVPVGTPIYSVEAGTVVTAGGADEGWGTHMLIVRDGEGWSWLYGHGSAVSVAAGQVVEAGQQIGSSGNEGFSTGPHLHIQVTGPGVAADQTRDVHCPQAELVAAFNGDPGPPMSSLSQSCVSGHLAGFGG
jgi:murein DD-endopeptidase MepM/ murein hydrolase activator NlpD